MTAAEDFRRPRFRKGSFPSSFGRAEEKSEVKTMKKCFWMILLLTAALLSACGGKEGGKRKAPDAAAMPSAAPSTPEETNPENGLPLSKQPDPTAPVLESIVIYAPDGQGKIIEKMEAAEKLTEEAIVKLLVEDGTLKEGAKFVSMEQTDSAETRMAGPGVKDSGGSKVKNATVTISGFAPGKGLDEETAKQAVSDSFRENYQLNEVELVLK